MNRRTYLSALVAAVAGCTSAADSGSSSSTTSETETTTSIDVSRWVDSTTETGVPYSAVRVEATGDPPLPVEFIGRFEDGSVEIANTPTDAEYYGKHGQNLYFDLGQNDPAKEVPDKLSGWLIFHPEEALRLISVEVPELGEEWARL